jgi:hypothetical protein
MRTFERQEFRRLFAYVAARTGDDGDAPVQFLILT